MFDFFADFCGKYPTFVHGNIFLTTNNIQYFQVPAIISVLFSWRKFVYPEMEDVCVDLVMLNFLMLTHLSKQ